MGAAGAERSTIDERRAVADRWWTLPYGEVRVGPGEMAIGVESLPDVSAAQRRLYEQAVAAAGVDPENVLVVRVTEAGIEVHALDPDDVRWPVRTLRVVLSDRTNATAGTVAGAPVRH